MPAHWLQVESCRAGFKSEWSESCSVFYPSKNALFSEGSLNADTDSASEESVKVIQGRVAHGTLHVRSTRQTMDNHHNKLSQVPEFLQ